MHLLHILLPGIAEKWGRVLSLVSDKHDLFSVYPVLQHLRKRCADAGSSISFHELECLLPVTERRTLPRRNTRLNFKGCRVEGIDVEIGSRDGANQSGKLLRHLDSLGHRAAFVYKKGGWTLDLHLVGHPLVGNIGELAPGL